MNLTFKRNNDSKIFQIGLLTGVFLLLYATVIGDLALLWWRRYDYSHGFLIPLISLYIVWVKRGELWRLKLRPMMVSGIIVVLLSGILLLVGDAGGIVTLSGISLVMMIIGIVLLLLGREYLKSLSFPIAYLFLMVPLLDEVIAPLHWPFQLFSAKMGVVILQMLGFSALLEQQYIFLPSITLEVAQECSGVNLLTAIFAIGLPLAYLTLRKWWTRIILILSGITIGIAANWARVVFIGIWGYFGGEVLHGPFHIFQGMFVAWVGYIALFIGAWGLSKVERSGRHSNPGKNDPTSVEYSRTPPSITEWNRSWWIAIVTLLIFAIYLFSYNRGPVDLKEEFVTFPLSIGEWVTKEADLQKAIFRIEGADHELFRIYRDREGHRIQLYVAYLESQRQSKEIVNYMTSRLHQDAHKVMVKVDEERFISVNHGSFGERQNRHRIIFWYYVNGRVIADHYQAKMATTWDALLRGRSNGAFVLLSRDILETDDGDIQQKDEAFVRDVFPVFQLYLP